MNVTYTYGSGSLSAHFMIILSASLQQSLTTLRNGTQIYLYCPGRLRTVLYSNGTCTSYPQSCFLPIDPLDSFIVSIFNLSKALDFLGYQSSPPYLRVWGFDVSNGLVDLSVEYLDTNASIPQQFNIYSEGLPLVQYIFSEYSTPSYTAFTFPSILSCQQHNYSISNYTFSLSWPSPNTTSSSSTSASSINICFWVNLLQTLFTKSSIIPMFLVYVMILVVL